MFLSIWTAEERDSESEDEEAQFVRRQVSRVVDLQELNLMCSYLSLTAKFVRRRAEQERERELDKAAAEREREMEREAKAAAEKEKLMHERSVAEAQACILLLI